MKEKVANQGITQVLREDASPLWSELHRSSFCGEAHTALRGWRPISAALSTPVPLLFVRGRKTSLINHWASRPIYNRGSIRESVCIVKLIPSKNISIRLAMPLPVKILTTTQCPVIPTLSRADRTLPKIDLNQGPLQSYQNGNPLKHNGMCSLSLQPSNPTAT